MEFVKQNRSGLTVSGMQLFITDSAAQNAYTIPALAPGASTVVSVPVNQVELSRSLTGVTYRSQLINPQGLTDVVPFNNQKASAVGKR